MLYVAIWYVSIRYEGEGRTAEQYLMINFIHNFQELDMFQTSVIHLQERSYAVCCNLVCLDTL